MARPIKKGLDYFPLDVDIDHNDKVALIEAEFGMTGFAVVVKLYMKIYDAGYFYEWSDKEKLLFSNRVKMTVEEVQAIVERCIHWELFDNGMFKKYGILTSSGIQERFIEATTRRKRVDFIRDYACNGVNVDIYPNLCAVNVDINGVNVDIKYTKERKGKESKLKESKEYKSDSTEYRLALLLYGNILSIHSSFKKPCLQKWAKDVDLMLRIDKRTPAEIEDLLEWVRTNTFWSKNILSISKLRVQFDRLKMETKNGIIPKATGSKYANIG